ncbi:MAG: cupredoxin domain-containing protein [Vulcanimicrobiota bacterium]
MICLDRGFHYRKWFLTAVSEDVTHGFMVKEYGFNTEIQPEKENVIEFRATKAGKFHFHCSVYCGEWHGQMHGTLVVKEK